MTYSEEGTTGTLNKTWNEIKAAFPNVIITKDVGNGKSTYICAEVYEGDGVYGVLYGVDMNLAANSADGYPTVSYD